MDKIHSLGFSYDSSAGIRDILRHGLCTHKGFSYDRTFLDCFDEGLSKMTATISDYQVSSAERFKYIAHKMLMNAGTDSDWHALSWCTSRAKVKKVNNQLEKE